MPKTAINISAYEAEEIKYLPDNTVLISINTTKEPPWKLKLDRLSSKVLTVFFDDVTAQFVDKDRTWDTIDDETALKILDFININKDKNFIVHCRAGISRSSAICLYLNLFHGHELKKDFWKRARPNKFVLGQLIVTRNRKI